MSMSQKTFTIVGDDISDGFHTFDELYDHRITLFIALCREIYRNPAYQNREVWRAILHSDGSRFGGWFVMGIGTAPGEQITYHLPLSRWDEADFAEIRQRAPAFDGHTASDVLKRISSLYQQDSGSAPPALSEEQITQMVDRFLQWKLPKDFQPDCGIHFDADAAKKLNPNNHTYEPVGTNLLTADQAREMVRFMIEELDGSAPLARGRQC